MSGPKKSSYEIRQEQREQLAQEKRRKRELQIQEIHHELDICQKETNALVSKYGNTAHFVSKSLTQWIDEIKFSLHGDLREAWRGIKGVQNYLDKNKIVLKNQFELQQKELQEQKARQQIVANLQQEQEAKKLQENKLKEEKINRIVENLQQISLDYQEILNDGIKQRVELFKNSITTNPDNPNTIKQIEEFRTNLLKQYELYQEKKENTKYVANVFAKAFGVTIDNNHENIHISGTIEGVAISVNVNTNNNIIDFDTPTDGSCHKGLEALTQKLHDANINIGPIKVLKTGQTIHASQKNNITTKVKA